MARISTSPTSSPGSALAQEDETEGVKMKKILLFVVVLFLCCADYSMKEYPTEEIPGWDMYGSKAICLSIDDDQYHQMTVINNYKPGDINIDSPILDCCAALWVQIDTSSYWYLWAWAGEQMTDIIPAQGDLPCTIIISLYDVYETHSQYFYDTIQFYNDMTLTITGQGWNYGYYWNDNNITREP
jgi:hypothetical protein